MSSTHGHPSHFQSFLVHTGVARTVKAPGYWTLEYDVPGTGRQVARG